MTTSEQTGERQLVDWHEPGDAGILAQIWSSS
jgi:hypothetical protein